MALGEGVVLLKLQGAGFCPVFGFALGAEGFAFAVAVDVDLGAVAFLCFLYAGHGESGA